jgi:hypothetical protein
MSSVMKLAIWTAGALALGWLATVASGAVLSGGHPPTWYFVGACVVLASFVVAPIGAAAAMTVLWRARRQGTPLPPLVLAALGLNLLFLMVAVALWFWFQWALPAGHGLQRGGSPCTFCGVVPT